MAAKTGLLRRSLGPVHGFLAIIAGTAFGQIATFFVLPVLARHYTPSQFGLLAYATSVSAIIVPIATLRLEGAFVLPQHDSRVSHLLQASLASLIGVAFAMAVIVASTDISGAFGEKERAFLVFALPLLILANGMIAISTQLAVREGAYSSIGARNTIQSLGTSAAQLLAIPAKAAPHFNGLVGGAIVGSGFGVWTLWSFAKRYLRVGSIGECLKTVTTYWRFPLVFAPTAGLTLLAQQGPIFVATSLFGAQAAGQLAMSDRLVAVPLALVGLSMGSVFQGEMGTMARAGAAGLTGLYLRVSAVLACFGAVAGVAMWVLGPWFVEWFAGVGWSQAAGIMRAMALLVFTRMVVNPTRRYLQIFERAGAAIALEALRVALFLGGVVCAMTQDLGLLETLYIVFGALSAADVMTWTYGLKVTRDENRRALANMEGSQV